MLKHIVLFRFKDFAEGADRTENTRRLKLKLESLADIIEEIRFFEVGVNLGNSDAAYDLALLSEFLSIEDLHSYQKHPEHVLVAEFAEQVCETRVVADYIV
jgi:hypothetical protein